MDHAVKHEFVDFGDNTDVARHQFADFRGFFALKNHRVRNFDRLLVVVDEQLIVTAQGTLVNTEHTDLADIRVINHLEDMGNKRKVRIGLQFDVVSVFIGEERSIGTAGKKTTTKKVPKAVFVEYCGAQTKIDVESYEEKVKEIWLNDWKRLARDLKQIDIYIKPEDGKVYFVVNGTEHGAIDL